MDVEDTLGYQNRDVLPHTQPAEKQTSVLIENHFDVEEVQLTDDVFEQFSLSLYQKQDKVTKSHEPSKASL